MDNLTKGRLEWMFENQPEYVKEFLDSNRIGELEKVLLNRVVEAVKFIERLKEEGRSQYEVEDIAIEVMLAPADGPAFSDNLPEPLCLDDQEKVYRKLERRQEILDLLSELQSKRPRQA